MPLHGKALGKLSLSLLLVCLCWTRLGDCQGASAALPKSPAETLGVFAVDASTGEVIWQVNSDTPLRPASVLKLITSSAALSSLGPEHTFETRILYDGKSLFVLGGGDPVLTTEDISRIATEISFRGLRSVQDIVVDLSRYPEKLDRKGIRAYEASPLALTFNFNSLRVWGCGTGGKSCRTGTDPLEAGIKIVGNITPAKFSSLEVGAIDNGVVSVRGTCRVSSFECLDEYRALPDPLVTFGKIFTSSLERQGIKVTGVLRMGRSSDNAVEIYNNHSRPLREIVSSLNHLSTNIIAEQLVYEMGCQQGECSRERGFKSIARFLQSVGLKDDQFSLRDGSGLSHENRVSARAIVKVLLASLKDIRYGPEFEASLAIGSVAGTLKRRNISPSIRGKTGSIDGVSSIAGVIKGESGKETVFAILQNGVTDKGVAIEWEEQILAKLEKF